MKIMFLTCGGLGKIPFAPGTWGSLAATIFAALILELGLRFGVSWLAIGFLIATTATCFWYGIKLSDEYITKTKKQDPSLIVIDEWVGQILAILLFVIVMWFTESMQGSFSKKAITENNGMEAILVHGLCFAGLFLLFRFFDIVKPWHAGWADRELDGGKGVMLDDVFAGIYAAAAALAIGFVISLFV
jgi:phosphatidylglycerophosphatase A